MNIALLLSGGVDSAVALHLLTEQGHRPDLYYIKIGMEGEEDTGCTAEEDMELCQATARRYGLPLQVIDLQKEYWERVDRNNPARLAHCVEICYATGKPYSSLLTHTAKKRPFRIIKIGLERPREELYDRINRRVEQMIADGLEQEARAVYPLRRLNSLQTVGYRELFAYFDGEYDLARAIELIQQNSRHYAKRQMTWFRRDKTIHWLNANEPYEKNIHLIDDLLRSDSLQEE